MILTWQNYEQIDPLFGLYYAANPTWGSLHVVLDDGNVRHRDIEFSLGYAVEHRDWLGAFLAEVLRQIPEDALARWWESGKDISALLFDFLMAEPQGAAEILLDIYN